VVVEEGEDGASGSVSAEQLLDAEELRKQVGRGGWERRAGEGV
jgi:hypothetical protein